MSRMRTLEVGILNIVAHPHPKGIYDNIIKEPIKAHGSHYCVPSSLYSEEDYYYGTFYKFLNIDASMTWLDIKEVEPILDDKGNPIPQVGENIKPNAKEVWFIFIPKKHRLVFDSSSISPSSIQTFIDGLMNHSSMAAKYDYIGVTVEQSQEGLEKIKQIYSISELKIFITKPNPDDMDDMDARIQRRLMSMHVDNVTEEYKKSRGNYGVGIRPDEHTLAMMDAALLNGYVRAHGKDSDGLRVTEATDSHPRIERTKYNPNIQDFKNALVTFAHQVSGIIRT